MRHLLAAACAALLALSGCTGIHGSTFVTGSADDDEAVATLGARLVRVEFDIGSSCSSMQPVLDHYAAVGARVLALAGFQGTLPTTAQAQSLVTWAQCFGPGTAWAQAHENFQLDTIEFGNETSADYQYPSCPGPGNPCYATRAQTYAQRFMQARGGLDLAGNGVKLLAQADDGRSMLGPRDSTWVHNLKVGGLTSAAVGGWTVHPYGPQPTSKVQGVLDQTAAEGFSASIPVDVTENGIASAECTPGIGRALPDQNHGWPQNLTYSQAATDLGDAMTTIRSVLGDRLGVAIIYGSKDGRAPCDGTAGTESYYGALKSDLSDKGAYSPKVRDELTK